MHVGCDVVGSLSAANGDPAGPAADDALPVGVDVVGQHISQPVMHVYVVVVDGDDDTIFFPFVLQQRQHFAMWADIFGEYELNIRKYLEQLNEIVVFVHDIIFTDARVDQIRVW